MMLSVPLTCAALLLALALLAVLVARSPHASRFIYAACMLVTAVSLAAALTHLLAAPVPEALTLPVGLPWLGAHLRLDALSPSSSQLSISAR
jgi:hydrogenase-4 component B